jgi:hypothetical protein
VLSLAPQRLNLQPRRVGGVVSLGLLWLQGPLRTLLCLFASAELEGYRTLQFAKKLAISSKTSHILEKLGCLPETAPRFQTTATPNTIRF